MKIILAVCLYCFVSSVSILIIAIAIDYLDETHFMEAMLERIKGEK